MLRVLHPRNDYRPKAWNFRPLQTHLSHHTVQSGALSLNPIKALPPSRGKPSRNSVALSERFFLLLPLPSDGTYRHQISGVLDAQHVRTDVLRVVWNASDNKIRQMRSDFRRHYLESNEPVACGKLKLKSCGVPMNVDAIYLRSYKLDLSTVEQTYTGGIFSRSYSGKPLQAWNSDGTARNSLADTAPKRPAFWCGMCSDCTAMTGTFLEFANETSA